MNRIGELKESIKLIETISKATGTNKEYLDIHEDRSRMRYYPKIQVIVNDNLYFNFCLSESPTGCGLMIIDGIISFTSNLDKCKKAKIVLDAIIETKLSRVGCLFATLGSGYYKDHEKNLKEIMGFEEVNEYFNPNMANGGQKLFVKKINQPKETPKKEEIKEVVREPLNEYIPSETIVSTTRVVRSRVAKVEKATKPIDAISIKKSRRSVQKL